MEAHANTSFTTWSGYGASSRQTFSSNQNLSAGWSVTRQWVVVNQGAQQYNISGFVSSGNNGLERMSIITKMKYLIKTLEIFQELIDSTKLMSNGLDIQLRLVDMFD